MARRKPRNRRHGSQGQSIPGGFQGQSHSNKYARNSSRRHIRQRNRGWTNPARDPRRQHYNPGQNQNSRHQNRRPRGRQHWDQRQSHRFRHNTVDEDREEDGEYREGTDDHTTTDEETDYDGEDGSSNIFSQPFAHPPCHYPRSQSCNVFLRKKHRGNDNNNNNYGRDITMDPTMTGTPQEQQQQQQQQQHHNPFATLLAAAGVPPPPPPRAPKTKRKKPCQACARARCANQRLRAAVERALAQFGRAWMGWLRAAGLPVAADAEQQQQQQAGCCATGWGVGGGGGGEDGVEDDDDEWYYLHNGYFRCCPDRMDWEPESTFIVLQNCQPPAMPPPPPPPPNPFAGGTEMFGTAGAGPGFGGLGGAGAGAGAAPGPPVFANVNNHNGMNNNNNNAYNPFANSFNSLAYKNNSNSNNIMPQLPLGPADQRLVERLFGRHAGFAMKWHEAHHVLASQFPAAVQVLADAVRRGVTAQQLRGIVAFLVALYRHSANVSHQGVAAAAAAGWRNNSSSISSSSSSSSSSGSSSGSSGGGGGSTCSMYSTTAAVPRPEEPAWTVAAEQDRDWYPSRQYAAASNVARSWRMRAVPY